MPAKKKKKVTKKGGGGKGRQRETLCVGSKVKGYVKSRSMKASGELVEAVSNKIYSLLDAAIERTTNNKRSTVRPHDL
jgi:hypothetical protein